MITWATAIGAPTSPIRTAATTAARAGLRFADPSVRFTRSIKLRPPASDIEAAGAAWDKPAENPGTSRSVIAKACRAEVS